MARSRLKPSFLTSRSTPCCAAWRKATYKRTVKRGVKGWGGVRDASERSIIIIPRLGLGRLHESAVWIHNHNSPTHLLRPHARLAPEEGGRGREATAAAAIPAIPSCYCCCPHCAPRVLLWSAPRASGAAAPAASCRFHLSRDPTALAAPFLAVGCRVCHCPMGWGGMDGGMSSVSDGLNAWGKSKQEASDRFVVGGRRGPGQPGQPQNRVERPPDDAVVAFGAAGPRWDGTEDALGMWPPGEGGRLAGCLRVRCRNRSIDRSAAAPNPI